MVAAGTRPGTLRAMLVVLVFSVTCIDAYLVVCYVDVPLSS
jgi:hypothetical protein